MAGSLFPNSGLKDLIDLMQTSGTVHDGIHELKQASEENNDILLAILDLLANNHCTDDLVLDSKSVAKKLDISLVTLHRLRKTGLPFFYVRGRLRYKWDEVSNYLTKNK